MAEKTKAKSETDEDSLEHSKKDSPRNAAAESEYYYDDAYGYEIYQDESDQSDDHSD